MSATRPLSSGGVEASPESSNRRTRVARAGLAAALMAHAGCLDAGPTPLGRHLLAGRDENTVALVAGPPGAGQRILLSHPQLTGTGQFVQELQVSTVDDPGPGA